ncbi:hypothetical protein [Phytoactinopolyspora limicola]|uniref:hypothetical protein n=1 Tax=Phytoactinopolyspora limicola TaxID=2715536 RepID=UPI001FE7FE72|nr:hypothetical protein [Phytoactinopolyspora limicola]
MSPRLRGPRLSAGRGFLHLGVEEHVERGAGFTVDAVVGDDEALKKGLVGDAAERVVDAHVDRVAVCCEGEAVVEVGLGLFVLDVSGVDLGVEERDP